MFSDMNHNVHVLLLCYMYSNYGNICNHILVISYASRLEDVFAKRHKCSLPTYEFKVNLQIYQ